MMNWKRGLLVVVVAACLALASPAVATTSYEMGLRGSIFQNLAAPASALNLDDAAYAVSYNRVFTGSKAGTILSLAEDPAWNVLVTGEVLDWQMFPGFTPPDYFATVFTGRFFPQTTGVHTFRWNNDDGGIMYMDLNDDGTFQAAEKVAGPAWGTSGTASLVVGQGYNFMYAAYDNSGGNSNNFWFTGPLGTEARVNPTAPSQAGMWMTEVPSAPVPEPMTLVSGLVGIGALVTCLRRRRSMGV
jgi:hypothetical protein